MYTTQASIQNKVGHVTGWRDLLTAVGFRLEGPVNGLPAAVFFPTSDPGDRLAQCSASLQAFLGKMGLHAVMCQNWAGSAQYRPSSGTYRYVYKTQHHLLAHCWFCLDTQGSD